MAAIAGDVVWVATGSSAMLGAAARYETLLTESSRITGGADVRRGAG